MFSRFLKFIVPPFSFRVFFRRIFYSNLKKVPLNKPLLFVGNHQNSFMDGILVGSYLPQPLHFTMRADMFRKPLARFCLRELNVAPVYRAEEGMENVHKNLESFEGIYEVLKRNGNFIMFSEGICIQEKRLHTLRKGTARLAFGAYEKYGLDVHIVPVGINYTYPSKFRKEVMINFHDSFSIRELKDAYDANPAKALNAFTQKCRESLLQEVIIIEDPKNDWLGEQLLKMERNNMILPFFRWRFDSDDRRQAEKRVSEKVNRLSTTSQADLESLSGKVENYVNLLAKNRLSDENVARRLDWGFLRYFAVIAGLPLFIAGYISNLLPFLTPRYICNRFIKDLRFYSSVYVSSGTVLYLIYFPVVVILASVFAGLPGFLISLLIPPAGYFVLSYQEIFMERLRTLRFSIKKIFNPSLVKDLANQRQSILGVLNKVPL
jgi:1-acyl-sn-glycerol-3-phosphate acyltransferase